MKIAAQEMNPGKKRWKHLYVTFMLWFVGRALQAVSRFDKEIREEIAGLPDNCLIGMVVFPFGESGHRAPGMFIQKTETNRFRYRGSRQPNRKPDFIITFKNIEMAIALLTFREKTTEAQAYGRFTVDGSLPVACTFARILNKTEIYLLPKPLAVRAVRRYENPQHKHFNRIRLYIQTLLGL